MVFTAQLENTLPICLLFFFFLQGRGPSFLFWGGMGNQEMPSSCTMAWWMLQRFPVLMVQPP